MTIPFAPAPRVLERAASNDYYRRAVETMPGYRQAVELRQKAFRTRGSLPVVELPPMPASAADDLDTWLDGLAQADALERTRNVKTEALTALVFECERTIRGAAAMPDRTIASVATDMDALMKDVAAAVERLDGAHCAHDALMKGGHAADVWRGELPRLRDAFDGIREAYGWLMAGDERVIHCRSRYIDDPLASLLVIRNLSDVFPAWRDPPQGIQTVVIGQEPDPRPWPTNDPLAQLVWLSTSGAQVWCPTPRQIDALNDQRRRPHTDPKTTPAETEKPSPRKYPIARNITAKKNRKEAPHARYV